MKKKKKQKKKKKRNLRKFRPFLFHTHNLRRLPTFVVVVVVIFLDEMTDDIHYYF